MNPSKTENVDLSGVTANVEIPRTRRTIRPDIPRQARSGLDIARSSRTPRATSDAGVRGSHTLRKR